ncbi:MAG TPA: hypothetical protein PKK92_06335, partial [Methanothrix sp.]|nr:hypothetical protein [Methanothrix sp.]
RSGPRCRFCGRPASWDGAAENIGIKRRLGLSPIAHWRNARVSVYLLSLARGPGTRGRELYAHRKEAGGKDRAAVFGTIYIDL